MLARRPDICAIIRELVVYPSGTWLVNDRTIDEASIADNIQMIAPNLRLHSFEWRGVHMAKDDMWMALKESCVILSLSLRNKSRFFNFKDVLSSNVFDASSGLP
jgi:hypothetical protein